eukprot:791628_1
MGIPPPPPPKHNKDHQSEEQITECPDWINKQVCDSFRTCPYFHDGVECDTWVEYGKCPEKDNGQCKDFHHRSIWIQSDKSNDKNNQDISQKKFHDKNNNHKKKVHNDKKDSSNHKSTPKKEKKYSKKESKREKHVHETREHKRDRDRDRKDNNNNNNIKDVIHQVKDKTYRDYKRDISVDSHVSVSSISSSCSNQTRELQVLKINVAKMVKKKRKVYKTELKQMYFDTFNTELNIDDYGYLNIVSFLKSIKCLAMHQGSNGSPLIVYNSANINNLRH